jgi:hypothetical protein
MTANTSSERECRYQNGFIGFYHYKGLKHILKLNIQNKDQGKVGSLTRLKIFENFLSGIR